MTNAVKHAFVLRQPGVLGLSSQLDGETGRIMISDDGPGVDEQTMPRTGLGYTLITRLARQAEATVSIERGSPGTRITLTFPVELAK